MRMYTEDLIPKKIIRLGFRHQPEEDQRTCKIIIEKALMATGVTALCPDEGVPLLISSGSYGTFHMIFLYRESTEASAVFEKLKSEGTNSFHEEVRRQIGQLIESGHQMHDWSMDFEDMPEEWADALRQGHL